MINLNWKTIVARFDKIETVETRGKTVTVNGEKFNYSDKKIAVASANRISMIIGF